MQNFHYNFSYYFHKNKIVLITIILKILILNKYYIHHIIYIFTKIYESENKNYEGEYNDCMVKIKIMKGSRNFMKVNIKIIWPI